MFVNKFKLLFFYLLVALSLVFVVVFIYNPTQLEIRSTYYNRHKFFKPNIFHVNEIKPSRLKAILKSNKIAQYRGGALRQGYFKIKFDPIDLKLNSIGETNINYSGHGASKSTPMHLDPYTIVAGDQGIVEVYKNKILYWTLSLFNKGFGFHSTPIIIQDVAFIGDYTGRFYFLDLSTKKVIWMAQFGNTFGATPLLEGNHLYLNFETVRPDGYVVKLNLITNEVVWTSEPLGNQSHSTPAADKSNIFIGDNNNTFRAISKSTGRVVWTQDFGAPVKSTPSVWDDKIYISSWDGKIYCLSKFDGRVLWTYLVPKFNQSSVAIDPDLGVGFVNAANGIHKINLSTGKRLAYFKIKMNRESRQASPVILEYKGKKFIAAGCSKDKFCFLRFENLSLVESVDLKSSISNQVGVGNNFLLLSPNSSNPLLILEP